MAPLWIGTVSSRRSRVSTKPPTCWERWRGKPKQRVGERDRLADRRIGGIEPGFAHVRFGKLVVARAPNEAGQRRRHVLLEAQRLAHLAHGHARPVVDDGRADGGALAAVAGIEVLDHLLAPLVLEIDVDVGRLFAVGGDEALEQDIDLVGIDAR